MSTLNAYCELLKSNKSLSYNKVGEVQAMKLFNSDMQLLLAGKQSPAIAGAIKERARQIGVAVANSNPLVLADVEKYAGARAPALDAPIESTMPQLLALNAVHPMECVEQIVAYYQPQFWVASGKLYGAEALARWDHPELGVLGPLHLLPVFHSVELRDALWARMLGHSMSMLKQLEGADLCIAVNVSADVANSVGWAENVAREVAKNQLSPSNLTIEITEEAGDCSDVGLVAAVSQLRMDGFSRAIDDFGIGFSSLQRLARTDFSSLKIDQCFVRHARSSIVGHKILASTIAMAHDLGLNVTAEGVETKDDFERVRELGADIAQGYYFAKPMPAADFYRYTKAHGASLSAQKA